MLWMHWLDASYHGKVLLSNMDGLLNVIEDAA